jgi:hypothetical protein
MSYIETNMKYVNFNAKRNWQKPPAQRFIDAARRLWSKRGSVKKKCLAYRVIKNHASEPLTLTWLAKAIRYYTTHA